MDSYIEGLLGSIVATLWLLSLAFLHMRLPGRKRREQLGNLIVMPLVRLGGLPHFVGEPIGRVVVRLKRRLIPP